ncbi:MAG: ABC transporter permease [Geminicoccaceae bacterium]
MSTHTDDIVETSRAESSARPKHWQVVVRALVKAPLTAKFGLVMIAIYIFVALFAPFIAPYKESQVIGPEYLDIGQAYYTKDNGRIEPLFSDEEIADAEADGHEIGTLLLGTDNLGRDMLTRLFYGARNTIGIAILTTCLAFALGAGAGMLAAAVGGWTDQILSRIVDVLMSIPQLIFALLLLTIFGTSIPVMITIIAVLESTRVFRLSRAVSMNVAVLDFVEAAKLRGEGLGWIMGHEILPNIMPPLVAEFGLRFVFVFLFISALSFLGLGIQPPTADWGSMVRDNATLITYGIATPLIPAGAIALLTISVNFVVDWFLHKTSGLRDEQ